MIKIPTNPTLCRKERCLPGYTLFFLIQLQTWSVAAYQNCLKETILVGPTVCVWGGDGRNIIIFQLTLFILKAIKILLFCIGVVAWCFCFLFIVALAHVCLLNTICLSVYIVCSYATWVWPEFIFNQVMLCSVLFPGDNKKKCNSNWLLNEHMLYFF